MNSCLHDGVSKTHECRGEAAGTAVSTKNGVCPQLWDHVATGTLFKGH